MTLFSGNYGSEDSNSLTFNGIGGRVVFDVLDYERPEGAPDFHDANWISMRVSVTAGVFSGSFGVSIGSYEFVELQRQLREALDRLSGTVSFESMEGDLLLRIEFGQRGRAMVTGEAKPSSAQQGRLIFSFETDQTFLSQAADQLGVLIRRFPVKT